MRNLVPLFREILCKKKIIEETAPLISTMYQLVDELFWWGFMLY